MRSLNDEREFISLLPRHQLVQSSGQILFVSGSSFHSQNFDKLMYLATRQPAKCVLCTFHTTRWEALGTVGSANKGSHPYGTKGAKSRSSASSAAWRQEPPVSKVMTPIRNSQLYSQLHPSLSYQIDKTSTRRQNRNVESRSIFRRENVQDSTLSKIIMEGWTTFAKGLSSSATELRDLGIESNQDLSKLTEGFEIELKQSCTQIVGTNAAADGSHALFHRLRRVFITGDTKGLQAALKHSFMSFVLDSKFSKEILKSQQLVTDLRYPVEWYPQARAIQRKIHLHVGPTNSGKTYQALKRLEAAETGIYAGPLRLLAHEIYTRLNAKGKICSLVTGEERRIPEGQTVLLSSCTVEMVPIGPEVDVAVIDEIQMISNEDRGWAWTRAFLGVRAKEVHLCGELRTIPLIKDLCAAMGDSLEIHKYERLSPLKAMKKSLKGDFKNLQKGDAIILFSRLAIHVMKKEIELATKKRCAVVYGSLPPETRAQQASLFNDPNNDYDYLVASDAVGMGLNLAIKRIIFETTSRWNGFRYCTVDTPDIKQIGGRAGRYRTAADAVQKSLNAQPKNTTSGSPSVENGREHKDTMGLVTTLEDIDLPIVQRAMVNELPALKWAVIRPPSNVVIRFAAYFPSHTPFSYILTRLYDLCKVLPQFRIGRARTALQIADCIEDLDLTIEDRIIIIAAPASFKNEGIREVIRALAKCIANRSGGEILDIMEINLELLDQRAQLGQSDYLRKLEALHQAVTLYLWLSYRFVGVFKSQALAFHIRSLVEANINQCLDNVRFDPSRRQKMKLLQEKAALRTGQLNYKKPDVAIPSGSLMDLQPEILHKISSENEIEGITASA